MTAPTMRKRTAALRKNARILQAYLNRCEQTDFSNRPIPSPRELDAMSFLAENAMRQR